MTTRKIWNDAAEPSETPAIRRATAELKTELIGVHCSPSMVAALDCFILGLPRRISRPEAIRRILAEWLHAHGHLH